MKTVYRDENNVVLYENSVERKPCINGEIKSLELTVKLYFCHDVNMKFLVVVTPPYIYQYVMNVTYVIYIMYVLYLMYVMCVMYAMYVMNFMYVMYGIYVMYSF